LLTATGASTVFSAAFPHAVPGRDVLKKGAIAEEVDQRALEQIRQVGLDSFLRHRTGHGVGLEGHESPWIAEGDKTVLRQRMSFRREPGVCDPDFGGVRQSDAVLVGKDCGGSLNRYHTRLEEMLIQI
jgi:Xaa-Pro dipeptidase